MNPKMKVLDDLEAIFDDRMVGKLAPKPEAAPPAPEEGGGEGMGEGSDAAEAPAQGHEPDLNRLSPEEQEQLEALYDKMCGG